jgi:membrane-associated phospholipid phosphatase
MQRSDWSRSCVCRSFRVSHESVISNGDRDGRKRISDNPTQIPGSPQTPARFPILAWLGLLVVVAIVGFWLDPAVVSWTNTHPSQLTRHAGGFFSKIGDWPELAAVAAVVLVIAWFTRSRRLTKLLLCMLLASTIAGGSVNLVRVLSGRTRPNAKVEQGWYGLWYDHEFILRNNHFHSFPSGHTAAAFGYFGVIGFACRRWYWLSLLPATVIGCGRLAILAHHLSDVLVGSAIGLMVAHWVWLRAGPRIERWLERRMGRSV